MLLDGPDCGIFIDTDVLAMTAPQSLPDSLAAVPASFNHHAKPVWEHVYNRFGLTFHWLHRQLSYRGTGRRLILTRAS
jgi:hypothetical protein